MFMKANNTLNIDGTLIGPGYKTYFIADIAANHDGDLNRAKDLICLAAEAGADAAKFQHFQAESIVSSEGFNDLGTQLSHQSKWKKSVVEVYKEASVNLSWTQELKDTCVSVGIPFFTTPYSLEVIDKLDPFVPAYKIGSGDITWRAMIEKIAKKNKPYFLACGASYMDEVIDAVSWALHLNPNLGLMQCNTNYTTDLSNFKYINLNVLNTFKDIFPNLVLGLSDHTPEHSTVLGAVSLGASMIEKHFTDDTSRSGPDHPFSMDPKNWKEMVKKTRELELALGNGIKKLEINELETVIVQRRSLRARSSLKEGHIINESDFIPLRPCPSDAISPSELNNIIGSTLLHEIKKGDYLKVKDIA